MSTIPPMFINLLARFSNIIYNVSKMIKPNNNRTFLLRTQKRKCANDAGPSFPEESRTSTIMFYIIYTQLNDYFFS